MSATATALLFDAPAARDIPAPRPPVGLSSVKPQSQALQDVPVTQVPKRGCSMTASEFSAGAQPLTVWVAQAGMMGEFSAQPKVFSTGSFGWYLSGKAQVQQGQVQVGVNLVVIGSKDGRCSLDAEEFLAAATSLQVSLAQPSTAQPSTVGAKGQAVQAQPKVFSTGSFGWYLSGKILVVVGGQAVQVQVGGNLVVIGSRG